DCEELELPQGLMLWSPWVDLTNKQSSFYSNVPTDSIPMGKTYDPDDLERSTLLEDNILKWQYESDFIKLILFGSSRSIQEKIKLNRNYYTNYNYLRYPLVSPLFDTKGLKGFPPTFIQVGDREILRDENILMAEILTKVHKNTAPTPTSVQPVTIQIYQDMPHSFQILQFTRISKLAIHRSCSFLRQCFVTNTPQFFHTKMYHPIDGTQPTFIKSKKLAIHQHHSFDGVDRFIYWASIDGVICVYKHGYFLKPIERWSSNNSEIRDEQSITSKSNVITIITSDKISCSDEKSISANSKEVFNPAIELTNITIASDGRSVRPTSSQLTLTNNSNSSQDVISAKRITSSSINPLELEKIPATVDVVIGGEFGSDLSINNTGGRIIEL
ncbi:hypothetical protein CONCODRAFT_11821, partial [Conidiobolus coronatus NRRL 28638]